jgi:hypothetical protein
LRSAEQPRVVVHVPWSAFHHDGRVATMRLPTDAPMARSAVLVGVLPQDVEGVFLRISLAAALPVRLVSADGERREMVLEFGRCPGEGVDVLGPPIDLEVVFVEPAKDPASLRASVQFW